MTLDIHRRRHNGEWTYHDSCYIDADVLDNYPGTPIRERLTAWLRDWLESAGHETGEWCCCIADDVFNPNHESEVVEL